MATSLPYSHTVGTSLPYGNPVPLPHNITVQTPLLCHGPAGTSLPNSGPIPEHELSQTFDGFRVL